MSDEEFQKLIEYACTKVSEEDLASMLKLSPGTVDRWRRGVTAPHPLGRPSVEKIVKAL